MEKLKQTKKPGAVALALVMVLALAPTLTPGVQALTSGDYEYEVSNGQATITRYIGSGGNITIPSTLGGYSVTFIDRSAFWGCTSLTGVTIPSSVTSIGASAFSPCDSLTSIAVNVTNPNYASENGVLFNKDKTRLVRYPRGKPGAYTIPDSVTSIGDSAFFYCYSLASVTIPNSITFIGEDAFASTEAMLYVPNQTIKKLVSGASPSARIIVAIISWRYDGDNSAVSVALSTDNTGNNSYSTTGGVNKSGALLSARKASTGMNTNFALVGQGSSTTGQSFISFGTTPNLAIGDYYQLQFSTKNYSNIALSADMRLTGGAPGDFYLQYSFDGVNYTNLPKMFSFTGSGDAVETLSAYLPPVLGNRDVLYLRIAVASTRAKNSSDPSSITSSGTWGINNIHVIENEYIDYAQIDLIAPGDVYGFSINLTQETITIPEAYTTVVYSTDGGTIWKPARDALSAAKFNKLFTKDITLWLSDRPVEKATKQPPKDATIVKFAKINKRPKVPALLINYEIAASKTGETLGEWVFTEKGGTKAVKDGIQIGVAAGKAVDGQGYGQFRASGGIAVTETKKTVYFLRTAPSKKGAEYTAANKPKKISAVGVQKAPKFKVKAKVEKKNTDGSVKTPASAVIVVKAGTYVSINGDKPKLYTAKADVDVLKVAGTVELWMAATAKKPASLKQTITR